MSAALAAVFCCLALVSCKNRHATEPPYERHGALTAEIAVSNSWLECCLRDLEGNTRPLVRVCPPGTCPGHFDIRPGAVAELCECRLMFLFDFQQAMSEKLATIAPNRFETIAIDAPEGLCVPASYLAGCQVVHDALCATYPAQRSQLDHELAAVGLRIDGLAKDIREQIQMAGLVGAKVVASGHQAMFCRWLGLDPVAAYSGPETASPAQIEALLAKGKSSGVRFVIANLQESSQAGEALAERLGVPVVIFSNFPSMDQCEITFDDLVRANVKNLLKAAGAMK